MLDWLGTLKSKGTKMLGSLYPRFKYIYPIFRGKAFRMLDVGCASHSPAKAKQIFRDVDYHGVDMQDEHLDETDRACLDRFFHLNLETDSFDEIPDDYYDVLIISHVIEHLRNGPEVIAGMGRKVKPGGYVYIEYPSTRSLGLPSMRGTLQFCDDPTHVRVYDLKEVANVLLANGFKVTRAGTRRDLFRVLLFPVFALRGYLKGQPAGAFWDISGFAEYVFARKEG